MQRGRIRWLLTHDEWIGQFDDQSLTQNILEVRLQFESQRFDVIDFAAEFRGRVHFRWEGLSRRVVQNIRVPEKKVNWA